VLVAAAVCPCPPVLVPEVAAGASGELDELRTACDRAVDTLLAAHADVVAVVGTACPTGRLDQTAGSFAGVGVNLEVGTGIVGLPLPQTIGCWLLDRAVVAERSFYAACAGDTARMLHEQGAAIAASATRVALLVLGDGTARRTERAPGYLDPRAEGYDGSVVAALRAGPAAVADLDGEQAAALLAAGWPAWQVLAGAAAGGDWACDVTCETAPYGVSYVVATWRRRTEVAVTAP
jgi:hypothetical protein